MDYEKLGAFYLGKAYSLEHAQLSDDVILYDAKDLTTHAVIIGMTGSGKTGLGIALLEEALIDNIPLIAIDPKGDLGNLLLSFPELSPENFRPWVNEQEALGKGQSTDDFAKAQAELWQKGLAQWGQSAERIRKLRQNVDMAIYTPGSSAGLPVSVLRSFCAPAEALKNDPDLYRERIQTSATSLLALMGIDADPISSREHILLATILERSWAEGKDIDLAGLIHAIQQPPFERIGVMEIDSFYPAKDRFGLAMKLNNLLAAPGFEAWLEGEALDIQRLLYSPEGKARATIFSISHLNDSERMFFVSMLLNEMLAWMRSQSGTSSLRALLYMDEIFGYLPPLANPPSKLPMLTLLKQARAFGLGLVLSTQNPVDLDYKALANCGTWFIGRLQTERDKERVLDGLQGASQEGFNKQELSKILSGLAKRTFLLHNVHEDAPVVFQTRWVMSYLAGPLTREQIRQLMAQTKTSRPELGLLSSPPKQSLSPKAETGSTEAPIMPQGIPVYYAVSSGAGIGLVYYPSVAGFARIHYSSATHSVNETLPLSLAADIEDGPIAVDWTEARELSLNIRDLQSKPVADAQFSDFPKEAKDTKAYDKWQKDLLKHLRQNHPLKLFKSKAFKESSRVGESEADFRVRLAQLKREERDSEVTKLKQKYTGQLISLEERLQKAELAASRKAEQAKQKQMETLVNVGTTLLGAFMGRKKLTATTISRASSSIKSVGRLQQEQQVVNQAQESSEVIRQQILALETEFEQELAKLSGAIDSSSFELEEVLIRANSTDIQLDSFMLLWLPYRRDSQGTLKPDWH